MQIRTAEGRDLCAIEEIYDAARRFMRESGNLHQWSDGKPNKETAMADMARGVCYVLEDGDEILAVFMFSKEDDPCCANIYEGEWKNDLPYAVIHRIAVRYPGRGLMDACINYCFAKHSNLKIDTHRDNIPMQKALLKRGFEYCGIIYLDSGDERLAYQKST